MRKLIALLIALPVLVLAGETVMPRVQAPTLSVPAGTYTTPQSVTATSVSTGSRTYCSTDGSIPTPASPPGPYSIASTTTLTCRSFAAMRPPSVSTSATYNITSSSSLIPANRITTWDPGIPGGIPAVTTVHSTISAALGNNSTDAASAINSAITAAGAVATASNRQVVMLPAGTYRVTTPIVLNQNHVVLRGAGPGLTRIVGAVSGGPPIRMGYRFAYQAAINVSGTAAKGATSITVANAATINVGDVLQIDQQDGPATATGEGHFWNGYVWLADGHFSKRQPTGDIHGPGTGGIAWGGSGTWLQIANFNAQSTGPWRSTCQQIEVTAKSGNTLTLRDPLHIAFEAARVPQVFKTVSVNQADNLGTRYTGLEDLAVTGGNNDNIQMVNVAYSWIKHVESDGELVSGDTTKPGVTGRAIQLLHAYRSVVRDSYVHHARSIVQGGGAYGIAVEDGSSANLIENNIVIFLNKPIVHNVSGGGNVIAYNYVDNAMITGSAWQENAIDGCHQTFSHSDLFEGNMAPNIGSDTTHGNAGWHVFYRNYAFGRNTYPYNIGSGTDRPWQNLRAVGLDALGREHTFVGNVLVAATDAGFGTAFQMDHANHSNVNASVVYRLGTNGIGGTNDPYDTGQSVAAVYRHGNWDNINGSIQWDASNANHALPSSLYLSSKPAFFGALPWPWVEPTGSTPTARVGTLPAKQRYDAGTPNG